MLHPLLIFSQSDYLIQFVDTNSHTEWQTVQIQISWLLQIWIYTVCKGRVYPGSAGQGLTTDLPATSRHHCEMYDQNIVETDVDLVGLELNPL